MWFRKTHPIIFGALCISLIAAGIFLFFQLGNPSDQQQHGFDAQKTLASLDQNSPSKGFIELERMVNEAVKQHGVMAGFALIKEGGNMGLISNDQCHALLHYVGHGAYAQNPTDFEKLVSLAEGTTCIGGYLHGIEAEMVLSSSNVISDVQQFCSFQKMKGVNPGACYHGVGHAAVELYDYDIQKSLDLCDALHGEPEQDLSNCYRGIFSEIGNGITGYDGHTGLKTEQLTLSGIDPEDPYLYCQQLDEKYRSSCISQFTKILLTDIPIADWLRACVAEEYDESTTNICINIVSVMSVRHDLSSRETTAFPEAAYTLTPPQQEIAILGSAEAFAGYLMDNDTKDWKSFCNTITVMGTKQYCTEVFTAVDSGRAPWMDRTDIR